MRTRIHVSGLSNFCTDDKLRQAFTPFGTVVLAQVAMDDWGHSLGIGIVHMSCSEDVARVFNDHQRFEVSGSRVDLWEPAEPQEPQAKRVMVYDLRDARAEQKGQDRGHEKSQKSFQWLAVLGASSHPESDAFFPDCQTLPSLQPAPVSLSTSRDTARDMVRISRRHVHHCPIRRLCSLSRREDRLERQEAHFFSRILRRGRVTRQISSILPI